jgi:hypothetical protein
MTDKEILELYNKLVEYYGPTLPHPEHQPKEFQYLVDLYKYHMEKNNE